MNTVPKETSVVTPGRKDKEDTESIAEEETFAFDPSSLTKSDSYESDEDSKIALPPAPPAAPVLAPTDKVSSALWSVFGVNTMKELHIKRANILASDFIAAAQGIETQLDLKLLHLINELETNLEDEGLKNFIKLFTVQYKSKLGVQTKMNLNKVVSTCLMHTNSILELSTSKTLKLQKQFSREVLLCINCKKYHGLMSKPISTVELRPFTPVNKQRM